MLKNTPAKQTTKAAKKVGKALSAFTTAADTLEAASAEHLAVAEKAVDDADALAIAAYEAHNKAVEAAQQALFAAIDRADALYALSDANVEAAEAAQQNADSLRNLLAVA